MTEPAPAPESTETTHFGFATVPTAEKTLRVQRLFEGVAGRYDLMNDLMSGGIHRLWKRALIERVAPRPGWRVLDLAGGTGDIAFRLLKAQPAAGVVVCDLTPGMLVVGRDRATDRGLFKADLQWVAGNAEALPFPDRSVEAVTIAFGLRNVTRPAVALAEARRVLKPGGRFFCLEFSHVVLPLLDRLYELYSFSVLPWLGEVVAKDRASYQYLAESIRRFPPQAALVEMMERAGLRRSRYENLSGGIAAIHSGWRI
jgi:demethylmenaquinone methyltransferase/2-methoxy-6-polyprenyl-1,4-benzoquinol methylase